MTRFHSLILLIVGVACITVAGPERALAERMVADLSDHTIEITSQFSGTELLIFGAIERAIPQGDGGHGVAIEGMDYDVIVVVQSERHDMVIRRKGMAGPIWVNKNARTVKDIPGYYALTSTRPLEHILPEPILKGYQLGLDRLNVSFEQELSEREGEAYRAGFVRNMKAKDLYIEQEGLISLLDEILFRAVLHFPANMPVGDYKVDIYLARGGEILLHEKAPLEVGKTGLERVIYNFAHSHPAYYGIVAILVALFAGWFSGFVSRKMSV
ncbi:TIGR02186 family protein [Paremcibacter congregatus]|uniref:TIGR02186 family protein n=1 Tax=Paremcibacter congregatus TaxID=2043170 RepID=A0A2G4YPU6_9PROT|nr:TIGR02186 family protein [Paremcibacter congregatus]PHZ84352.1 hypothetical protein CRD36_11080 [Paremcibacter congregatus]QDE28572.1 hypothetical protein FIV45_15490 [Paremcibacter congregatus]